MRKEFDWSSFKNEKIAVCCETEEEAKDFIECAYEHVCEWKWNNPKDILWEDYESKSCYGVINIIYCRHKSYFEENNYTILEWCDYMEKEFTINDVKSGYMVELVDGRECLAVEDYYGLSLYNTKTWDRVMMREDAKFKNESQSNTFYDITKVYGYKQDYHSQNTIDARKLLWKYEKPKKELTIEEIEKELGYGIKIIGDK